MLTEIEIPIIRLSIQQHDNKERLFADFPYNKGLNAVLKEIPGARWSKSKKMWHFSSHPSVIFQLKERTKNIAEIDLSEIEKYVEAIPLTEDELKGREPRKIPALPAGQTHVTKEQAQKHLKPFQAGHLNQNLPGALKPGAFLNDAQKIALRAYYEMLKLKNYSANTIKNYCNHFANFLLYFNAQKPSQITKNEILDYLVKLKNSERWSSTIQNQKINAIKFFYERLLKRPKQLYDLPRAKKEWKLPAVFAEDEVKKIINAAENVKHKTMLCIAYAGGLRVSEIVSMKVKDIDSARMVITVRQGKGRKDRQVMLSETLLILLREYYKKYKPKEYIFEGQWGGQYSSRSLQKVLEQAKQKAGVKKKGSIHAFRHSFATHLLEGGTDIFSIKELLGHSSIRTTTIYAHVSKRHLEKIQSPLDKLKLK